MQVFIYINGSSLVLSSNINIKAKLFFITKQNGTEENESEWQLQKTSVDPNRIVNGRFNKGSSFSSRPTYF